MGLAGNLAHFSIPLYIPLETVNATLYALNTIVNILCQQIEQSKKQHSKPGPYTNHCVSFGYEYI